MPGLRKAVLRERRGRVREGGPRRAARPGAPGRRASAAADPEGPGHREGDRGVREDKKRTWGALSGGWGPPDTRDAVIDFVATWSAETELPTGRGVGWLGLGASKYFDWKQRYGKVNERNGTVPRDHRLAPWEQGPSLAVARRHP